MAEQDAHARLQAIGGATKYVLIPALNAIAGDEQNGERRGG